MASDPAKGVYYLLNRTWVPVLTVAGDVKTLAFDIPVRSFEVTGTVSALQAKTWGSPSGRAEWFPRNSRPPGQPKESPAEVGRGIFSTQRFMDSSARGWPTFVSVGRGSFRAFVPEPLHGRDAQAPSEPPSSLRDSVKRRSPARHEVIASMQFPAFKIEPICYCFSRSVVFRSGGRFPSQKVWGGGACRRQPAPARNAGIFAFGVEFWTGETQIRERT